MAKKILIVDDSGFMRMRMKDVFIKAGYEIVGEVEKGSQAVQEYRELHPDLVTMDIVMQGQGGIQSVKEIIAADSRAKILMVSAMGQQALIIEAIQEGARGFVIKPFKQEQLLSEAGRILKEES